MTFRPPSHETIILAFANAEPLPLSELFRLLMHAEILIARDPVWANSPGASDFRRAVAWLRNEFDFRLARRGGER